MNRKGIYSRKKEGKFSGERTLGHILTVLYTQTRHLDHTLPAARSLHGGVLSGVVKRSMLLLFRLLLHCSVD